MYAHDEHVHQSNSFLTGFAVGLFVGAAGFYLYGTDDGAKMRKQIAHEWEKTKVDLAEQGVIERPDVSLKEFLLEMLGRVSGEYKDEPVSPPTKHLPRQKRDTGNKFKGV
jgi:hypothetical protein